MFGEMEQMVAGLVLRNVTNLSPCSSVCPLKSEEMICREELEVEVSK